MANSSDFGVGKTVLVLAIVVGCFAILWPKVFYPMMQAALVVTKPARIEAEHQGKPLIPTLPAPASCCDVIYENEIDLRFFAELCDTVLRREVHTDAAIRHHRRDASLMPSGMLKLCRQKIEELCDKNTAKILDLASTGYGGTWVGASQNISVIEGQLKQLTDCLEVHFTNLPRRTPRRLQKKSTKMPNHVHQERTTRFHPGIMHTAFKEKGHPFPNFGPDRTPQAQGRPALMGGLRPNLAGPGKSVPPSPKGGGAMGLVMPVYTVGIIIFFVYTIMKIVFKKPEDTSPKTMDFHMDPEHRKFVLNDEYENGSPRSFNNDYYRRSKGEIVSPARATEILGDDGRKIVFTAIEGIIAEMDEFSEKLAAERTTQFASDVIQEREGEGEEPVPEAVEIVQEEKEEPPDAEESTLRRRVIPSDTQKVDSVASQTDIVRILDTVDADKSKESGTPTATTPTPSKDDVFHGMLPEEACIAILGMETQARFDGTEKHITFSDNNEIQILADGRKVLKGLQSSSEISNIVLDAPVAAGTHLLVAESECTTQRADSMEGWSDMEDQPIVVTGKMTISLLADGSAKVVEKQQNLSEKPHSAEKSHEKIKSHAEKPNILHVQSAEKECPPPPPPTPPSNDQVPIEEEGEEVVQVEESSAPLPRETSCPSPTFLEVSNAARQHIEQLASTLIQDIFHDDLPTALKEVTSQQQQIKPQHQQQLESEVGASRHKLSAWRQASKESMGSRTSSFEYVTADLSSRNVGEAEEEGDEERRLREKSPADSDAGNDISGFDYLPESDPLRLIRDNQSFEKLSISGLSLSPETPLKEDSFENLCLTPQEGTINIIHINNSDQQQPILEQNEEELLPPQRDNEVEEAKSEVKEEVAAAVVVVVVKEEENAPVEEFESHKVVVDEAGSKPDDESLLILQQNTETVASSQPAEETDRLAVAEPTATTPTTTTTEISLEEKPEDVALSSNLPIVTDQNSLEIERQETPSSE